MPYLIATDTGQTLDARIDVVGASVTLHSRGGPTGGRPARNEGHGPALITICRRAQMNPKALARVLIDSAVARRLPETDRLLLAQEECGSAWKRDPGSGVIGVEKGPLIPVV